ncbi:MAG: Maf family protein, partial [Desulfotomaculaceae bacterium]|nr:Maf family protein [Desulfotomaculaceae bacterium]
MKKLILASSSPRRAELLKQIGLDFEIITGNVDETPLPGLHPPKLVEYLAGKKAAAVARELQEGLV